MNLTVAPTAFVIDPITQRKHWKTPCLYYVFILWIILYTKGDRDGIHTEEAKENLQTILYNATQSKWCPQVHSRNIWLHDCLV